jgi:hypothetical protein
MGVSPLDKSESPVDHTERHSRVRQVAYAGQRDAIVPVDSIRSAIRKLAAHADLIVEPEFDRRCCWVSDWVRLRELAWRSIR